MTQQAQRLPYSKSCPENIFRIRGELQRRKADVALKRHQRRGLIMAPFNTDPRLEDQRQKDIERLRDEIEDFDDQIRQLEYLLERMEEDCKESEANLPADEDRVGLERSLRETIDDPRYWRDGEPTLANFVSDGFKRLYPGESEG